MSGIDISIVGMACIFPKAPDLPTYWANICNKVDAITTAPPERLDGAFFTNPSAPEHIYVRRGGFIDEYASFDASAFGIMPVAAEGAEPDQLLALKVASEALTDAGYANRPFARDRTSVILGRGNYIGPGIVRLVNHIRVAEQLSKSLRKLLPGIDEEKLEEIKRDFRSHSGTYGPDTAIGLVPNLVASRIANRLDLGGSAYTVDAACSSTLVAVDQACRELAAGQADMVIAGGVHLCHDPSFWSVFAQLGALSRSETIRPFDRRADGLLIGEGVGIAVLKRKADALRDGDRVYATIRGIGISSDGRDVSLMNPGVRGQLRALQRAWETAELDPSTVGLVEAHGTATPIGDSTELETLATFFGPPDGSAQRAGLGSVKSMIGHTMPAAGAAALIKAALAVYHGVLPPSLHCEEPHTALESTRFRIITSPEGWNVPLRRAAVNAFGFGGINAHLILDAPEEVAGQSRKPVPFSGSRLQDPMVLAADSKEALLRALDSGISESWAGRWRIAVFDPTPQRLVAARAAIEAGQPRSGRDGIYFSSNGLIARGGKVAFMFPGLDALFQPRVDDVVEYFGWEQLNLGNDADLGGRAAGVFQVNDLMLRALGELGVEADVMAGHSIGEWCGMVASGMLEADAALSLLTSVDPDRLTFPDVGYLAVGAASEVAAAASEGLDGIIVSQDNCPHQTVLCGPTAQLKDLRSQLMKEGVLCELLPFRSGFHSAAFASFVDAYASQLEKLALRPATVSLWSATTCAPYPSDPADIRALFREHLLSPVRFRQSIEALYEDGVRVFVQVGAGSLTGFVDDTLQGKDHLAIAANVSSRPGMEQLRRCAAMLFVEGVDVKLERIGLDRVVSSSGHAMQLKLGVPLVELSVPPLEAVSSPLDAGPQAPGMPASDPALPVYSESLRFSVDDYPDLLDHCLIPQPEGWPVLEDRAPTVPLTMSIDLMRDLAKRADPSRIPVKVEQVMASDWLTVQPPLTVVAQCQQMGDGRFKVSLPPYVEGIVTMASAFPPPPSPREVVLEGASKPRLDAQRAYLDRWLFHGPAYQGMVSLEVMGRDGIRAILRALPAPGALLDAAGQVAGLWIMIMTETDRLAMPVRVGNVEYFATDPQPGELVECLIEIKHLGAVEVRVDIELVVKGEVYARISNWEDWRFQTSNGIFAILRHPERNLLAEPRGENAVLVHNFGWSGATIEYLANRFLSARERAQGKARPEQRKYAEWLAGRIAAKDAVRRYFFARGHGDMYPVELEVASDAQGRPRVQGPFNDDLRISIAHKDKYAAAIVTAGVDCGIDIERVEFRNEGFIGLAFSQDELELLPAQSPEWLTRLWTAKEAVGKSLGTGMAGDPRSLRLSKVEDTNLMVNDRWVETQQLGDYILGWTRE